MEPKDDSTKMNDGPVQTITEENPMANYLQRKTNDDVEASYIREAENAQQTASMVELFSFGSGPKKTISLIAGIFFAILSGLVMPATAFIFSRVFQTLGASTENMDFMSNVKQMALSFISLGAVAFICMTLQLAFMETAACDMAISLKNEWFKALLRQDLAFHDLTDVSGTATSISANASKYRLGVGKKLGEGIQSLASVLGGFAYAFWASWQAALVILAVLPLMVTSGLVVAKFNERLTTSKDKSYADAGSIVYSTSSSIKTVLSLNACQDMIDKFHKAIEKAYHVAASKAWILGLCSGGAMAAFLMTYVAVTLYGSYLLYAAVRSTGCDPSGGMPGNIICPVSGADVFGALIGLSFGGMGMQQVSIALECLANARAACYPAICAINRNAANGDMPQQMPISSVEQGEKRTSVTLPKYKIDSSSTEGLKPSLKGRIQFKNVCFAYPSRPGTQVFKGFSLDIEAGKTVALVGPSGSGKSTITALIERFYDPQIGTILLDGEYDLSTINVAHLRSQIGLVSQEPSLFACTIEENIGYGKPGASHEEIVAAAKKANAHDFIMSFPDGYKTAVGDRGAQLSGGQKQRIAIARVIVRNPKILILDEATSALDSESELVVQRALDDLLQSGSRTTIIIAHRLSTIRGADTIAVVENGQIVEQGNHDSLMSLGNGHYKKLVEAQASKNKQSSFSVIPNTTNGSSQSSTPNGESKNSPDTRDPRIYQKPNNDASQICLEFKEVDFFYPTRPKHRVFKGLNLSLMEGETVALVGPSGQGKSSIVSLIERFYDITSGSIELYGEDIRKWNLKSLRSQIGLVSQEPVLFSATIAENIILGCDFPVQQTDLEVAAKLANAHDFIMSFPEGYNTQVGERGVQVSGGQKQRVAIARAMIRKPSILILDEATSALDSESEKLVQDALDNIIKTRGQTTLIIAHRLSTIKNADRIAVVANGEIAEIGSYERLISIPNGRFKRMSLLQSLDGKDRDEFMNEVRRVDTPDDKAFKADEDGCKHESKEEIEEVTQNAKRARLLAMQDAPCFLIGSVGALIAGVVFPSWGTMFALMIRLLFQPVPLCTEETLLQTGYSSCNDLWAGIANDMRSMSFKVTGAWFGVMAATIIGNLLLYHGFNTASERMNRRIRLAAFQSLVRQECAFFDTHPVGIITTQIQDDCAMLQSFMGDPIRFFILNLASVAVGLVIAFAVMWPFALLTLGILPFMAFGSIQKSKRHAEMAKSVAEVTDTTSGGVAVETLVNIRTVASLSLESVRSKEYEQALIEAESDAFHKNVIEGTSFGLGQLFQNCGMALMFWWGGFLLQNYSYSFEKFLISMFSLLFSLSGMGVAAQGITDRDKAKLAAKNIFGLIDRKSAIDPLGEGGKKTR